MNDKQILLENKTEILEQYQKILKEMQIKNEYEDLSQELSICNKNQSKHLKNKI